MYYFQVCQVYISHLHLLQIQDWLLCLEFDVFASFHQCLSHPSLLWIHRCRQFGDFLGLWFNIQYFILVIKMVTYQTQIFEIVEFTVPSLVGFGHELFPWILLVLKFAFEY